MEPTGCLGARKSGTEHERLTTLRPSSLTTAQLAHDAHSVTLSFARCFHAVLRGSTAYLPSPDRQQLEANGASPFLRFAISTLRLSTELFPTTRTPSTPSLREFSIFPSAPSP